MSVSKTVMRIEDDSWGLGVFDVDINITKKYKIELFKFFCALKFLPVQVEYRYDLGALRYMGYSPHFKKQPLGARATEYILEMEYIGSRDLVRFTLDYKQF